MTKIISLVLILISANACFSSRCAQRKDRFSCNYFAPCHWSNNKCHFGRRGLNSNTDFYSLSKTFKPNLPINIPLTK